MRNVFLLLWVTYAFYYLGRLNLAVALPGIMAEFGLDRTGVSIIGTTYFWSYAMGQFVNGHMVDRFGARRLVLIGLLLSAGANLVFGFSPFLAVLTAVWALNGYAQSTGWPSIIKIASYSFSRVKRGLLAGGLVSSPAVATGVSVALAGVIAASYGWRAAFFMPSGALLMMAAVWYLNMREPTNAAIAPSSARGEVGSREAGQLQDPYQRTSNKSVTNTRIWLVAGSNLFLNGLRLGFIFWAPTFLMESQGFSIDRAAFTSVIFPVVGVVGVISSGWVSDRWFGSRVAPLGFINSILSVLLILLLAYALPRAHWSVIMVLLGATGFTVLGAHALLVAVAPLEYARTGSAGSATGIIEGWGYMGAGVMALVTGALVDAMGWNVGFLLWSGCALGAALFMLPLLRGEKASEIRPPPS